MPRIVYRSTRFSRGSQHMIQLANEILDEYAKEGLDLTLRQLYYQFVARGLIANQPTSYKRLGAIVSKARLAGLIDWDRIEDRSRHLNSIPHWKNPREIVQAACDSFHMDHWEGQEFQPEVWIEKDALTGVIEGICNKLDVPFFACRGYNSQSEAWRGAMRLRYYLGQQGRHPVIIHLGDHDPSGIDMTRDNRDRLSLFRVPVTVHRIALNMDQIEEYNPPPNPTKLTDSRANEYCANYGDESWELDALEPRVIRDLIADMVLSHRDDKIYQKVLRKERKHKRTLTKMASEWKGK